MGIDDWALNKCQSYGTTLVDLEARRVVDLLPERAALPVANWLQHHPTIEAIVRDSFQQVCPGRHLGCPRSSAGR